MSAAKKLKEELSSLQKPVWNNRVLIVEDEPEIGNSYREILSQQEHPVAEIKSSRSSRQQNLEAPKQTNHFHFDITVCSSTVEALKVARLAIEEGRPFAMGFFDVVLGPGMDGIELVRELHKLDPQLYAVFVTAYHDRSIHSIHELLGKDQVYKWDYLNKPFTEGEIVQKARNFVAMWNMQRENAYSAKQLASLQETLREGERLSAIAAVARGVTHEFGNILLQIMGKADISRKKEKEEMQDALEKIIGASQRATEILNRFKNLSQPSAYYSNKEAVRIDKIIKEALDLMEHQIRISQTKVVMNKLDTVTACVHPTSLLQVIINLTINAIYAMKGSGQIDFSLSDKEEKFELLIRDYGPGIDENLINKVTEAFFTTKGTEGTGLGLAICKGKVEIEHMGHFELKTQKDLRYASQYPRKLWRTKVEANYFIKILVVDDDSLVLEVLEGYLRNIGFRNITVMSSASNALKLVQDPKRFDYDLVLSDWEMPNVKGLQILQALRSRHTRADTKFIMITSQQSIERTKITKAAWWKVDAYIVKPFFEQTLKEKIFHLMGWQIEKSA